MGGCERQPTAPRPAPARPTVASLVPGATNLIVGMGAGDHLVAVSHYDVRREEIAGLPRVGDYQGFDWEQLATIRPEILIVFMHPDRQPPGLRQRAEALNMRIVNHETERLDDVFAELDRLGQILNEPEKASAAADRLRQRLSAVRDRVQDANPVRTLLVSDAAGTAAIGSGKYFSDVLEIAGGENVLETSGWLSIDRERILALKPDVVLVLLPEGSPQAVREAQRVWATMPQVPAVAGGRVHVLTEWWALQPGMHLGEMAERFADLLHPPHRTDSP